MLNFYYYNSKKIKCKLLVVETVKTGQGTSWLLRVSSANETKNRCNDFNVCIKETIRRRRIYIIRFWETLSSLDVFPCRALMLYDNYHFKIEVYQNISIKKIYRLRYRERIDV